VRVRVKCFDIRNGGRGRSGGSRSLLHFAGGAIASAQSWTRTVS
jgi:hypothetical protein